MIKIETQISIVMILGILSLLAVFLSHLALTDIYHGESDVSLEWKMVQVTALIIMLFIGSSLFTLGRVLKLLWK